MSFEMKRSVGTLEFLMENTSIVNIEAVLHQAKKDGIVPQAAKIRKYGVSSEVAGFRRGFLDWNTSL